MKDVKVLELAACLCVAVAEAAGVQVPGCKGKQRCKRGLGRRVRDSGRFKGEEGL